MLARTLLTLLSPCRELCPCIPLGRRREPRRHMRGVRRGFEDEMVRNLQESQDVLFGSQKQVMAGFSLNSHHLVIDAHSEHRRPHRVRPSQQQCIFAQRIADGRQRSDCADGAGGDASWRAGFRPRDTATNTDPHIASTFSRSFERLSVRRLSIESAGGKSPY